jgi:transcription elongation factor GreA
MSEELYLTKEGAQRLKAELEELEGPARDEMAKRLRAAIQEGDLSENADYIKAKEDQGFLEGRIQELKYLLENAKIIERNNGKSDVVELGATVTIQEEDYPPDTYLVVGASEADPQKGRISNESPIGKALIGKKAGESVTVTTPAGKLELKILSVE